MACRCIAPHKGAERKPEGGMSDSYKTICGQNSHLSVFTEIKMGQLEKL